jgi:hypothetical protein
MKEDKGMINVLVSLDADLASSIAFRYSCRLTEFIDMRLQTIHVEEVEKEGFPPGSGWVRSTWEKGLLQTAQQEISQLIDTEKPGCPPLDASIVRIGDKEDELLHEIEDNSYDLLLEGVLHSFDGQLFFQKVRSKLYKYAPCPIILVKNLVDPGRIALLLMASQDVSPLVSNFLKIFGKSKASVDLVHFIDKRGGQTEFKKKASEVADPELAYAARTIGEAATLLAEGGCTPKASWIMQDRPKKAGELLGEYGLVAACLPRSANKGLALDLLSRVPSATLLCKR